MNGGEFSESLIRQIVSARVQGHGSRKSLTAKKLRFLRTASQAPACADNAALEVCGGHLGRSTAVALADPSRFASERPALISADRQAPKPLTRQLVLWNARGGVSLQIAAPGGLTVEASARPCCAALQALRRNYLACPAHAHAQPPAGGSREHGESAKHLAR